MSGTLKPRWDQRFTVGIEAEKNIRSTDHALVGFHLHLSLRNWEVISDTYEDINDSESTAKDKSWGYVFGWLSGTSMLGAGWHLAFASREEARPWFAVGTRIVLFIDTRDEEDKAAWAHAAHFAIGYDLGKIGIGIRTTWAPDAVLFGSTGAPLFGTLFTIETLED